MFLVVAFGIDEAELIGPLEQRFDDAPRNGGLAARGSAAHENTVAVGFEHDGHAALVDAERESLAIGRPRRRQVGRDELGGELLDAGASFAAQAEIGRVAQ